MKKLFLTLLMLLLPVWAWGATALEVVDYIPNYRVFCGDATYLYASNGSTSAGALYRFTSTTDTGTNTYNFGATYNYIQRIWTTSVAGEVFVETQNTATGKFYLFKSIDYTAHFGANSPTFADGNYVAILGDTDGTTTNQIAGVDILQRGFLDLNGDLYFGEYNVASGRSDGSTNDQVRLMKSTNRGTTWGEAAHWNTDGSHNNVRHIHLIQSDGTSIFIGFGDTDAQSGIMKWDGVTAITSNQILSGYANTLTGSQQYRTGDILFPSGNYAYYMSDTCTPDATRGIWKLNKDMSASIRVNADIVPFTSHSGWYGVIAQDGSMIFSDFLETGFADAQLNFLTSTDGTNWTIAGKYGGKSEGGGCDSFFTWGGSIVYTRNGAGKNGISTIVFRTNGAYTSEFPTILHPVYWVSTTGSDGSSPKGYRPSSPWATLGYALVGSHITNGGRVILGAGAHSASQMIMDYASHTIPGDVNALTVVEGQGRDVTSVVLNNGTDVNLFYIGMPNTPILFTNFWAYSTTAQASNSQTFNIRPHATYKNKVYLRDMKEGNPAYAWSRSLLLSETVDIKRLLSTVGATTSGIYFDLAATRAVANIDTSIFSGHLDTLYLTGAASNTNTLSCLNSTFYNFTRAIRLKENSKSVPIIKNNIFNSSVAGGSAWFDESSPALTETNTDVAYNAFYGAGATNANLANNATMTGKVTADPQFKNAPLGDFRLKSSSPCKNAGVNVGLTTDFLGKPIRGLPDIGAYELQPVSVGGGFNLDFTGGF